MAQFGQEARAFFRKHFRLLKGMVSAIPFFMSECFVLGAG